MKHNMIRHSFRGSGSSLSQVWIVAAKLTRHLIYEMENQYHLFIVAHTLILQDSAADIVLISEDACLLNVPV